MQDRNHCYGVKQDSATQGLAIGKCVTAIVLRAKQSWQCTSTSVEHDPYIRKGKHDVPKASSSVSQEALAHVPTANRYEAKQQVLRGLQACNIHCNVLHDHYGGHHGWPSWWCHVASCSSGSGIPYIPFMHKQALLVEQPHHMNAFSSCTVIQYRNTAISILYELNKAIPSHDACMHPCLFNCKLGILRLSTWQQLNLAKEGTPKAVLAAHGRQSRPAVVMQ